ncbi:MAG: DUF992 domain-containing protein [Rhodopseudomonas sp.]|nr:DUF992 domain-containing protein [Rhodopseudomonas sp.]
MKQSFGAWGSAIAAFAVAAAVALPVPALAQGNHDRTKVGALTCDISGGIGMIIASKKNVTCVYTPSKPGPRELYIGSITKFGLDVGATSGGEMVWTVFAPSDKKFGALAGHYGGASAEATVGAGVGANVLVGGSNRTVTLQPLSVQGQAGLNLAVGVAGLDLRPAR